MRGQDAAVGGCAGLLLRLEHDRAAAAAEQYTSAAVAPVENPRKRLGPDNQRAFERAGPQVVVGGGKREDEARTYRLQAEGRAMVDAELILHGHGGCGKGVVRRRSPQPD